MGIGFIAKLLSFVRTERNGANISDVKVDPGGGPNVTGEHFSAPGDDSHPLPNDYAILVAVRGSGRKSVVGYADPVNPPEALDGEVRRYARDDSGAPVSYLWLRNTGILELNGAADFAIRYAPMLSAFNQAISEINAAIAVFNAHVHPDPVSGNTGPPTTTQTDATADMTAAKVDEVKLP